MKLTHEVHGMFFVATSFTFLYLIILFAIFNPSFDNIHGILGWIIISLLYILFLYYDLPMKLAKLYQRLWGI